MRILLAGFPPHQPVPLHLYREIDGTASGTQTFAYLTTVAPIIADVCGEAIAAIRTTATDPPRRYAVQTEPGVGFLDGLNGQFSVSPGGDVPPPLAGVGELARAVIEQANGV